MAAVKTKVGDDFIDHVVDAPDFETSIARQEKTVANLRKSFEANPTELLQADLGRAVQRLSEWYRWQGRYDESLPLKDEAIGIWAELKRERARTLVQLQKALTLHLAGDKESAYTRFELLFPRVTGREELQNYLDFAYEWRGLCYARDGRIDEALSDLRCALSLRKERGNQGHVEETQSIVERLENLATDS